MRTGHTGPAILALVLVASVLAVIAQAATPGACQDGVLAGGALSRICVPASGWNGDLVVWAHGYVAAGEPLDFYHLILPGGQSVSDIVQALGFAFATTSYRVNGLAILPALDDVAQLVAAVPDVAGRAPGRAFITGASEGGLVTALLLERSELFDGGLAGCGPIGSFRRQLGYVGDFRVLFDYFFPGVLPGSPISIPEAVIDGWDAIYAPAIAAAVVASPVAAGELIQTSGAAIDPADPGSVAATAVNVLWYSVFGTNDAAAKLGGNPYGNATRVYRGSSDDASLNAGVARFTADATALAAVALHETSGEPLAPLVSLHTTGDEVVPYWHERLYAAKAAGSGDALISLRVRRYGHCAFTAQEWVAAFGRLLDEVRTLAPSSR